MTTVTPIVLYVEDEEIDRFFMTRAFETEAFGASLRLVNDGQAAIDYLSGSGDYADRVRYPLPAMVLLDLNMPGVHGFEVLKWIRTQRAHSALPVVIFSSSDREDDQARARLLGANGFVKKPNSGLSFQDVARKLKEQWLNATAGWPISELYSSSSSTSNRSDRVV